MEQKSLERCLETQDVERSLLNHTKPSQVSQATAVKARPKHARDSLFQKPLTGGACATLGEHRKDTIPHRHQCATRWPQHVARDEESHYVHRRLDKLTAAICCASARRTRCAAALCRWRALPAPLEGLFGSFVCPHVVALGASEEAISFKAKSSHVAVLGSAQRSPSNNPSIAVYRFLHF